MNVSKALTTVILRQLVTILREVSSVLVTVDTWAVDLLAQVNAYCMGSLLCCQDAVKGIYLLYIA